MTKKISNTKKIFIGIGIVCIIALISAGAIISANKKANQVPAETMSLEPMQLANYASISGTVKSSESRNVYTTLNYPIDQVFVKVGDVVQAGDVLATLNISNLKQDVLASESTFAAQKTISKIEMENKVRNYENALSNYKEKTGIEKESAEKALKLAEADLKIAQANSKNKSQEISLKKQQKMLKEGKIIAPMDGTVTLANATIGAVGTGVLFVIENPNNLEIATEVKEIDVAKVTPGLRAEIKSDSTGEKVIKGFVARVAPAAKKGINGETKITNDVSFETIVKVDEANTGLLIGMNTRISVVLEEKSNVFAVPFEAIIEKDNGTKWIYYAEKAEKSNIVKEMEIKTGLETDFYTEIQAAGLKDGLVIITNPTEYKVGDRISVKK